MTLQEQAKKIEQIYNEAMEKLAKLQTKRKDIIGGYIKELEDQKIGAIRKSLGL